MRMYTWATGGSTGETRRQMTPSQVATLRAVALGKNRNLVAAN
jgi:hypothetical protein